MLLTYVSLPEAMKLLAADFEREGPLPGIFSVSREKTVTLALSENKLVSWKKL